MGGISPDKPAASCAECCAWGVLPGSCCRACYTFRNLHPTGECAACHRIVPIKQDYCRLCRLQALEDAKAVGKTTVSEPFLRGVRHQQLFFTRMHRDHYRVPGRVRLGKLGTRGLRPKSAAIQPPQAAPDGIQLQLPFDLRRDYRRFDRRQHADLNNPAVIRARRTARALGEARGWSHELAKRIDEGLVVLLSNHTGEDKIRYSELIPAVRHRGRIAEVLDHLGLLDDDRIPAFETWLERKLDGLVPGICTATEDWIRTLRNGGPRTHPRNISTVWSYLSAVRPILLAWSRDYHHLREVTREDIHVISHSLQGNTRHHTLYALRSLFRHCKKNGVIFRDPTARLRIGPSNYHAILPLQDNDIVEAATAATTPATRLTLALAAIHAARTTDIGQLLIDDIDLGNRRLTIAGRTRPLDDLTHRALLDWLDYRRTHWPNTANPYLLVNRLTAVRTCPVGRVWITKAFWGLKATLDRLHADRQLEESLTHGPDPLHLAAVFGLSPSTAIRYAAAARQLLDTHPPNTTPPQLTTNPSNILDPEPTGP